MIFFPEIHYPTCFLSISSQVAVEIGSEIISCAVRGMSGVQGGLGEQKRDILKLREEASPAKFIGGWCMIVFFNA